MPDSKAQRPGDIVKSLSRKTIEVINTDGEGRLVLADIITYVQKKYKPSHIIDFATLTGAVIIALGTHKAGLFSNIIHNNSQYTREKGFMGPNPPVNPTLKERGGITIKKQEESLWIGSKYNEMSFDVEQLEAIENVKIHKGSM